jgi:hypothetical protein
MLRMGYFMDSPSAVITTTTTTITPTTTTTAAADAATAASAIGAADAVGGAAAAAAGEEETEEVFTQFYGYLATAPHIGGHGARFRQDFALEVPLSAFEFHAFAPLESLPCVRPMPFISGVHSSYQLTR